LRKGKRMELLVTMIFITLVALFSICAFYVANEKEEKDEKRTKGKRR
jgi:heme/copper-type cytochrome/quinol oxidase subunit 2